MVFHGQPYLNRAVVLLGLIATSWFMWANPIAMRRVILACVCGAAVAMLVYLTVLWTGRGRVPHPLGSIAVAVWFFPAMILMFALTPMSIAVGAVLVFATTRVMAARWDRNRPPLSVSGRALLWKRLAVALACSVTTHSAIAAYARGSTRLSAALFAGIIATLTSLAIVVGAYAPAKPARLSHSAMSVLLIVLLTVGLRMVKRGGGGSGFEDGGGSSPVVDDSFPGVILLRELEKNAVLIAPNLKRNAGAKGPSLFDAAKPETLTQPMDVTFSGEYWMLLPRYRRPPPQSLIERGNPSKLSFSTNGGPMVMEAHQPLSNFVDPASCDRIQFVVLGPDTQNMLAFQLFLVDTELPDLRGEESLGFQFVRGDPSKGDRETVSFPVPAATRLRRFNEIKVVFRQPRVMSKSVKIAIERMTIVPR